MRMVKWGAALVLVVAIGLAAFVLITAPRALSDQQLTALKTPGNAQRGEVIFNAGGCASCHATPEQEDRTVLGGGLELASAFGAFVVPNISSHPQDGIGLWQARDLANAMLEGVSPRSEHYYPAFPYAAYTHAKIEDIADLMAYLRTLPAVEGKTPSHRLSFPFNIRALIGGWKFLFFDRTPVQDDSTHSAQWNRGRYLVEALGHCAECHSPRNALGGIIAAQRFAGGPDPEGKGWVPNLTQHEKGLKDWSIADIEDVLASGSTPEGDYVGGSMAKVVRNSAQLSKEDREAMADYIKSLAPIEGPVRPPRPAF